MAHVFCRGIPSEQQDLALAYQLAMRGHERGSAVSTTALGWCYYYSVDGCLEKDLSQAERLWEQAAAQHDSNATYALAELYRHRLKEAGDVSRSLEEVMACFRAAADAGHLGAMLTYGILQQKQPVLALAYWKRAADLGQPDALKIMRKIYKEGNVLIPRDDAKVAEYDARLQEIANDSVADYSAPLPSFPSISSGTPACRMSVGSFFWRDRDASYV